MAAGGGGWGGQLGPGVGGCGTNEPAPACMPACLPACLPERAPPLPPHPLPTPTRLRAGMGPESYGKLLC